MDFILKKLIFRTTNYKGTADDYTESSEYICLSWNLIHFTNSPHHQWFCYNVLKATIPLFQIILHGILSISFKYQIIGF